MGFKAWVKLAAEPYSEYGEQELGPRNAEARHFQTFYKKMMGNPFEGIAHC